MLNPCHNLDTNDSKTKLNTTVRRKNITLNKSPLNISDEVKVTIIGVGESNSNSITDKSEGDLPELVPVNIFSIFFRYFWE